MLSTAWLPLRWSILARNPVVSRARLARDRVLWKTLHFRNFNQKPLA